MDLAVARRAGRRPRRVGCPERQLGEQAPGQARRGAWSRPGAAEALTQTRRSTDRRSSALGVFRCIVPTATFRPRSGPDGLHLEERRDPLGAFRGAIVEPVEPGVGRAGRTAGESLDVVGGDQLDVGPEVVRDAPDVDRVDVDVTREDRHELALAGEDVDDAARHVAVARTSVSVTAGRAAPPDARTTTALPATSGGARRETRPSSDDGPVRRRRRRLSARDREVEVRRRDGFDEPRTWAILSAQPAYQTQRSIALATISRAFASRSPSAVATSATNWSRRPSISSATR